MPNASDFVFAGDLRTADAQSAKPKRTMAEYPKDGAPMWNNPGQVKFTLAEDKHVRKYFQTKMGAYNSLSQPTLWSNGQHILESLSTGSQVTQVIQQQDKTYIAEAPKNNKPLQMLHRARSELNMADYNQFIPKANVGILQTFQSLLQGSGMQSQQQGGGGGGGQGSGGQGSGLVGFDRNNANTGDAGPLLGMNEGLIGMTENLLPVLEQIAATNGANNVQVNAAVSNNQFLDDQGAPLKADTTIFT